VLLSKHRGGNEDRDLLSVQGRGECSTHRHFRFSIAHVSANEAVHHVSALQVAKAIIDGLQLVFSLFEGKFGFKSIIKRIAARGELLSHLKAPLRVEIHEIDREFLRRFLRAILLLLKSISAELVERSILGRASVFLKRIEAINGEIKLVPTRVFEVKEIIFRVCDSDPNEAPVAPKTMIPVKDAFSFEDLPQDLHARPILPCARSF
jgi:hypothetical protein